MSKSLELGELLVVGWVQQMVIEGLLDIERGLEDGWAKIFVGGDDHECFVNLHPFQFTERSRAEV